MDVDEFLKEAHQVFHLRRRTRPVLGRERVEGQFVNSDGAGVLDDSMHGLRSSAMALRSLQSPELGPTAIAIHDDRDVPGKREKGFDGHLE